MPNKELRNQILYNFIQLVESKLKLKPLMAEPRFGTFDWWKKYIWGENKIQNYIYIVSFAIAFLFVIYYTLRLFNEFDNLLSVIITSVLAIALLFILLYFSFKDQEAYTIPKGGSYAEVNPNDYGNQYKGKVFDSNADIPSYSTKITWYIIGIFVGLFLITVIFKFVFKNNIISNIFTSITLFSLAAIIIAINFYYVFFIPQFIIITIIFQKIILSNYPQIFGIVGSNKWLNIGIPIVITLLLFGLIWIKDGNINQFGKNTDSCGDEIPVDVDVKSNYNFQFWFIFTIIGLISVLKVLSTVFGDYRVFGNLIFDYDIINKNKGWELLLEPLYHFINNLSKTNV